MLASVGCNDPVINDLQATLQGYPCLTSPLSPGWRNEYHAGLQQAFGRYLVFSGEYIWKYTHKAYDFSVLGNTPITYPIEWSSSKIPGYASARQRAELPWLHRVRSDVQRGRQILHAASQRNRRDSDYFGRQRIPHRPRRELSTRPLTCNIKWKTRPWIGFNWRYDSGLVAGPAPCAGGNCNNGPNGTDSIVDVSNLTPDQQFEAGLFCGSVHATPTTPISASGLCPASQYGSSFLKIPAPGTENDDHNPPRIASSNLFDVAVGHDNIFHGDRYKWSLRLSIVNHREQRGVIQFPIDVQRDALRNAPGDYGNRRVPLLSEAWPSERIPRLLVPARCRVALRRRLRAGTTATPG